MTSGNPQASENTLYFVLGIFGLHLNPDFFVISNVIELSGLVATITASILGIIQIIKAMYNGYKFLKSKKSPPSITLD